MNREWLEGRKVDGVKWQVFFVSLSLGSIPLGQSWRRSDETESGSDTFVGFAAAAAAARQQQRVQNGRMAMQQRTESGQPSWTLVVCFIRGKTSVSSSMVDAGNMETPKTQKKKSGFFFLCSFCCCLGLMGFVNLRRRRRGPEFPADGRGGGLACGRGVHSKSVVVEEQEIIR